MTKKIETLDDTDLDAVTGAGDSKHKEWIPILSIDQGISRPPSTPADTSQQTVKKVSIYYNKLAFNHS